MEAFDPHSSGQEGLDAFCKALDESECRITFCERFDEKSDIWNLQPHCHDFIEFIYFMEGGANVVVSEKRVSVSLYNAVVYPAGARHTELLDRNLHQEIICIGAHIPGISLEGAIRVSDSGGKLRWLFENIHSERKQKRVCELLEKHLMKAAFMLIARLSLAGEPDDPIDAAVQYMHANMSGKLSTSDLAERMHVSESYFIRTFKKKLGVTPTEYLHSLRIGAAKYLLATTEKTASEIAYLAGFNSPKYFYRIFNRLVGLTPGEFRRSTVSAGTRAMKGED